MKGPQRTPTEIEATRAEIARLDRSGLTQQQIGEQLGMSQQLVSYNLRKIRHQYLKAQVINRHAIVIEKLAELKDIKREAWERYEQSKQTSSPDWRMLVIVLDCISAERELVGLDLGEKVKKKKPPSGPIDWDDFLSNIDLGNIAQTSKENDS
jgi:transcriptional regulator with XRE-family HTH domain